MVICLEEHNFTKKEEIQKLSISTESTQKELHFDTKIICIEFKNKKVMNRQQKCIYPAVELSNTIAVRIRITASTSSERFRIVR